MEFSYLKKKEWPVWENYSTFHAILVAGMEICRLGTCLVLSVFYFVRGSWSNHVWDFWHCHALWRQIQNLHLLYFLAYIKMKQTWNLKMIYLKPYTICTLWCTRRKNKKLWEVWKRCASSDTSCLRTLSCSLLRL